MSRFTGEIGREEEDGLGWEGLVPTKEESQAAKEVYCHECSKAGGAERAIYHLPPACKPSPDIHHVKETL